MQYLVWVRPSNAPKSQAILKSVEDSKKEAENAKNFYELCYYNKAFITAMQ